MSLPKPNVKFRTSNDESQYTVEDIRGIITNPVYAGVREYPRIISDELWVRTNVKMLKEVGTEQHLVNLLYVLRRTFGYYGEDGEGEEQALANFLLPYLEGSPKWKTEEEK